MSKTDVQRIPDYLGHILEAIERIVRYLADTDEVAFLNDQKTQDAVVRNFEISAKPRTTSRVTMQLLPLHIQTYHGQFIYAMRNRVAHGYFKVCFEMIWKTIHSDLPQLHAQIKQLLDQFK